MIMEWIRDRRKVLGLTQQALAAKIGVSALTVSNWETGRTCPSKQRIAQMTELLGGFPPLSSTPDREKKPNAAHLQRALLFIPRVGAFAIAPKHGGGIGKVVEFDGQTVTLEYFVHPGDMPRERRVLPLSEVEPPSLIAPQTRCYFRLGEDAPWQVGRVLRKVGDEFEVDLPNGNARYIPEPLLYLRCDKPIEDPIEVLKLKAHETPFFHDRRQLFVKSLTEQRAASRGMTGLLSAAIELLPHQVEVVRRVLEDPIQRYLLADEVGLGKTIEAGAILRQYLLDDPSGSVRVFVPPMLVPQWETELARKFDAFALGNVEVSGTDELETLSDASIPGMVVLDEAHHLAALAVSEHEPERARFESFRRLAHGADRLLLLSATPALHNERSFLAMLHLLDPKLYRLDDAAHFQMRVARRQQVGQLLLSLREGVHPFVIRQNLRSLRATFVGDEKLETLASALEKTLEQPEREFRDAAIRELRVHVSETYRLHRRMLRNRRLVVGEGLRVLRYVEGTGAAHYRPLIEESDGDERIGEALELLESWRNLTHTRLVQEPSPDAASLARLFCLLWECTGTCFEVLAEAVQSRLERKPHPNLRHDLTREDARLLCELPLLDGEDGILAGLVELARREPDGGDRCEGLVASLQLLCKRAGGKRVPKVLVFTAYTRSCEVIVQRLRAVLGVRAVVHHRLGMDPEQVEEEVNRFREAGSGCDVLVCDRTGEEGRNLQMADVVIHFDLPLSPNRIEQRIGRVDRIGRALPMRSHVFVGPDIEGSSHSAWFALLHEGFGVFRQSIAALQFFVEACLPAVREALFQKGEQGLREFIPSIREEIQKEHARLSEQDELDAIEALSRDTAGTFFHGLHELEARSTDIEQAMNGWVLDALRFVRKPSEPNLPNIFEYAATAGTLVPMDYLLAHFDELLNLPGTHHRPAAARNPGTMLLRLGDAFVDRLVHYMNWDDRGRCFALWRHEPSWDPSPDADRFFFRFDYLVEADLEPVLEVGRRMERLVPGALRRWADALYAPFMETIFMDGRTEVRNPEWLAILERIYRTHDKGGYDRNLAKSHLRDIDSVVEPSEWAELCQRMRESSEVHLRMRDAFEAHAERVERRAKAELDARLDLLRLRAYHAHQEHPDRADVFMRELEAEEAISQALLQGIRSPNIRLDSVGFLVISGRPLKDV
ncbi:helix-turn-helix domain-containing protein [Corallococcus sp. AB050B]|nr:helix-turn-helix domain-containing protein [Corallococcus sp. AB050B]